MKIICIGMNYSAHCAELENTLPTEPVFFMKPETALLRNNEPFYIPDFSTDLHYECELVVRINKMAKAVEEQFASRYYDEIGLGIDFTSIDLQRICRAKGLPWEMAKSFDNSAAIAPSFINKNNLPQIQDLHFELTLNGEVKQKGFTGDMIFSVE
ncbi:MAG: fumarylacetoacetate hydrolase family protein, partial [Mucinivorans sp.]